MRTLCLSLLSLVLFLCDTRWHCFDRWRAQVAVGVATGQFFVNEPVRWVTSWRDVFKNRRLLVEEHAQLRRQQMVASAQLLRLEYLEQENNRLRKLLGYAETLKGRYLMAEQLRSVADDYSGKITLNQGVQAGIHVGQPVLGEQGLIGQVIEISDSTCRVLPITHSESAVPVMVLRNGLQAVAVGMGRRSSLALANIAETADVRKGDLLVTSGLGGVFPAGFPVGVVGDIQVATGERFLNITLIPKARADTQLQLLLFWNPSRNDPSLLKHQRRHNG